jgi:hypothetical protein
MKKPGSRIRRSLRSGWLAGLAAASIAAAVQAETPRFNTRGPTTSPRVDSSITTSSFENALNGTPSTPRQTQEPGALSNGYTNGYTNGSGNGCGTDCGGGCTDGCCDSDRICDNMYLFGAVNAWRGPLDGPSLNSFGFVTGFNVGVPVLKDHGIGFQFGASYGVYDFHGRDAFGPESEPSAVEDQVFFTTGLFHHCVSCGPCASLHDRVSWGVVYDYMLTDNTGAAAAELNLGQVRAQIGYAVNCACEIGIQGSVSDGTSDDFDALATPHHTKSIDQASLYWRHICCCSGFESRVWAGWAEDLGDVVVGASASMPITNCWSVYGGFTYILPSSTGGVDGSREEFWNVTAGFAFYPGGNARHTSVCCPRWMPLLPVADNGSFALDLGF